MLKWIAGIAAGLVWCVLVFALTWYVTFPSQTVVDRIAFEVQKASNGSYALKAGSASPWWAGLALSDVTLMSVDDEGQGSPMLMADRVRARTSLMSLISGGLPVTAIIDLGDSPITIDAELDRSTNPPSLIHLDAEAPELSVATVGALLAPLGASMQGTGSLDVTVDIELGETVDDHDGRMKISGRDLLLDLTVPDPISGGDFTISDMKVSELDLVLDVGKGKAELQRGRILSDRAEFDIDLDVTLNQNMQKSRLRGTMVMSNLGGELAALEPAFAGAKWDDGKYHYRIACSVDRLSGGCIRPERQPRSRAPSRALPDPGDIQDRVQRDRDRGSALPTPADRNATPSAAQRPGSAASAIGDRRDDEDMLDDEEPEDDEEEFDEDPTQVAPVEIELLEPPGAMNPRMLERDLAMPPN